MMEAPQGTTMSTMAGPSWLSPTMDLTGNLDPSIEFSTWFFNDGGTGTPNDTLAILFTNGTDTVSIQQITANTPGMASWVSTFLPRS